MADAASLSVRITGNIDDLNKKLNTMQRNIKKAFGGGAFQQSQRLAAGIGIVAASFGALGIASVRAAANMEQTRMAFTTLLKDGQKANEFLEKMEKFAKSTPFDLPGVLDASKQMLAFGFQAQEVIPILRSVGDASAALSLGDAGIQRLTLALGQMSAIGKVTTNDIKQIANTGVPAWEILAEKIGVSVPEAMEMASKGSIDAATGIQAIVEGMNSRFGGMMEAQEKTLIGMWANIEESIGFVLRDIGDQIIDTFDLHSKLEGAKNALEDFSNTLKSSGFSAAVRQLIPPETITGIYALSGALIMGAVPALAATTIAAIKTNLALLPLLVVGAAAGVAFQFLTENGVKAEEALIVIASVLTVAYIPAIHKMIFATGTAAVAAIKNFVVALVFSTTTTGAATTAMTIARIAVTALQSGFLGLIKTIGVFLIPFAKIIIVAGLVAAAAIAVYRNWGKIKEYFAGLADYIPSWASGIIGWVKEVSAALLEFIGLASKAKVDVQGMGDFRSQDRASDEEIDRLREERAMQESLKRMNLPTNMATAGGSGSGGSGRASELEREIDRINEKLLDMKDKTRDVQFAFEQFKVDRFFSDLEGANAVFGEIEKNRLDALNRLSDEQKKFAQAELEAAELYNRAVKTGNSEQIASTKAMLDETTKARIEAAQYIVAQEKIINAKAQQEMTSVSTAQSAIRANMDLAYREGNTAAYMQMLSDENMAFITHIEEQQALMQQHYDWRREAESTLLDFQLQAMSALKDGLASAFSDAIVHGKNLGDTLKDLGKQIVAMFVQWQAQRMLASAFSRMMGTKDAAAQSATMASLMPQATALAWNVLVFNPGAAGIATGLQSAGMTAAAGMGAMSGVMGGAEPDVHLASGGIVTRPTFAEIGEGRHNEAVLPLHNGTLDKLFAESLSRLGVGDNQGGATQSGTVNIFGNVGTEDAVEQVSDAMMWMLRGG